MTAEQAQALYAEALRLHQDWMDAPSARRLPGLRRAIELYQNVLAFCEDNDLGEAGATLQNILGNAYWNLPGGDRQENLRHAINCYSQALLVLTHDAFPANALRTLGNLGNLYFTNRDWPAAQERYRQAIDVVEHIRTSASFDSSRRRIMHDATDVFERAMLCASHTQQYDLALTLTERGKTRTLTDHLWRRDIRPQGVASEPWLHYQRLLAEAAERERTLSTPAIGSIAVGGNSSSARSEWQAELERLQALRRQSVALEESFRAADPGYLPFARPLEMPDLAELTARTEGVLVEFHVTEEGTLVFLLGPAEHQVAEEQVVVLSELTVTALNRFLMRFDGDNPVDGWLEKYQHFRKEYRRGMPEEQVWLALQAWLAEMEKTSAELYRRVVAPVHGRLRQRYPEAKRLLFVPNKGLNLLPLHAASWIDDAGQQRCLLDDYEIAYAPSCQVLSRCLAREKDNPGPASTLFAVQNPDDSLPFADWEVEAVAELFKPAASRVLVAAAATAEAVKTEVSFGQELLFSCHGLFDFGEAERSRLQLAAGQELRATDVVGLNLRNTWLGVMSACETGLTDFHDLADEYQGLPAAFLVAGSQTVVASLWAVSDASTALLMQRFHANLYRDGMAKAPALREAQLWLRELPEKEALSLLLEKQKELLEEQKELIRPRMTAANLAYAFHEVKRLARSTQGKPFANPHWWAAFQCVGAGWPLVKG